KSTLFGGTTNRGDRRAIHPPPGGGLPLRVLARQHLREHFILLRRRQQTPLLATIRHIGIRRHFHPPNRYDTPPPGWMKKTANISLTQTHCTIEEMASAGVMRGPADLVGRAGFFGHDGAGVVFGAEDDFGAVAEFLAVAAAAKRGLGGHGGDAANRTAGFRYAEGGAQAA